jgi:ornithine cyclodeaminase/alanine dehydrogenase
MMDNDLKLLYLSRRDVVSLDISMGQVIARLEEAFIEKAAGRFEMPPKPAIHTNGDAFLHAMPAFLPRFDSAGMKWVGGSTTPQPACRTPSWTAPGSRPPARRPPRR